MKWYEICYYWWPLSKPNSMNKENWQQKCCSSNAVCVNTASVRDAAVQRRTCTAELQAGCVSQVWQFFWISLLFLYCFWISCRIWFSFSLIFTSLFLLLLFLSQIIGERIKNCHKMVTSIIMSTIDDTLCIHRQGLIHNILREPGVLIRRTSTDSGGGERPQLLRWTSDSSSGTTGWPKNMMEWLDAFLKTSECFLMCKSSTTQMLCFHVRNRV